MTRRLLFASRALFALLFLVFVPATATQAQEIEELIELCTSCHGENGVPIETDIPVIWGQEFYYLYVQLKDYKAGRRANDIMSEIVADMDKATMQALSQHFAEKEWPNLAQQADDSVATKAEAAFTAGLCTQCHLGSYTGNSRVPRLAGQQLEYLDRTMLEFKNKIRLNSPAKGSLFGAYDDGDIAAMADYLAGL